MSLSERLKKILATEEEEEEGKGEGKEVEGKEVEGKEVEKANKPKLVRKEITLGCKPINTNLSEDVKRFNK